jgi:hypothetical protein
MKTGSKSDDREFWTRQNGFEGLNRHEEATQCFKEALKLMGNRMGNEKPSKVFI